MSMRTKVKELKRELILEEASRMFTEEGFETMKVSELAEKVGVSVGTIYSFFESKEKLFYAYVIRLIGQLQAELERRSEGVDDPAERLRIAIALKFEHFDSMPKRPEQMIINDPLFFYRLNSADEAPCRPYLNYKETAIAAIMGEECSEKTALMANILDGMANGVIVNWLEHDYNLMEKVDEVLGLFLKMVKEG